MGERPGIKGKKKQQRGTCLDPRLQQQNGKEAIPEKRDGGLKRTLSSPVRREQTRGKRKGREEGFLLSGWYVGCNLPKKGGPKAGGERGGPQGSLGVGKIGDVH